MNLTLSELHQRHQKYLDMNRAAGKTLITYQTPCCGYQQTTVAADLGEKWDSFAVCLGCGSQYWRVIADDGVRCRHEKAP